MTDMHMNLTTYTHLNFALVTMIRILLVVAFNYIIIFNPKGFTLNNSVVEFCQFYIAKSLLW